MKKINRFYAIILSVILLVTILPEVAAPVKTQAASEVQITSPTENALLGAGHIIIKWSASTSNNLKNYKLYVDGKLEGTTTSTSYDYYTTKVEMYSTYVVAEYNNGTSTKSDEVIFSVTKKGLCANDVMGRYLDPLAMNMGWYYTWGTTPFSYTTYSSAEFVPMIWGTGNEGSIPAIAKKGYKYLLAYNEPDMGP